MRFDAISLKSDRNGSKPRPKPKRQMQDLFYLGLLNLVSLLAVGDLEKGGGPAEGALGFGVWGFGVECLVFCLLLLLLYSRYRS